MQLDLFSWVEHTLLDCTQELPLQSVLILPFLSSQVFGGRHSPTSASGTQASQFVCRCNVIPEVQWVVPVTDSFFLEITVVKYKSGEFVFLSKPTGVNVFLSSCLFARAVSCCNSYEVETECPNPFNKSITLVEPVQCLTVIASATCFGVGSPPSLDDKNTISW